MPIFSAALNQRHTKFFFLFQFSDKKEKWVPVEIPITTQKHRENSSSVLSAGGARINSAKSSSRPNSRTADKSKNWRDDAKGKALFCYGIKDSFYRCLRRNSYAKVRLPNRMRVS